MSSQFARLRGALDRVGTTTPGTIVGVFAEDLTAIMNHYVEVVREAAELKAARAQPAQAGHFHQALTDPENQPNQYGVEFLMHGPKFAFKVGAQQFTLDYETTEPGEFEFMRDALIHAFSVFTPDVKPAQAGQVLTEKSDG